MSYNNRYSSRYNNFEIAILIEMVKGIPQTCDYSFPRKDSLKNCYLLEINLGYFRRKAVSKQTTEHELALSPQESDLHVSRLRTSIS